MISSDHGVGVKYQILYCVTCLIRIAHTCAQNLFGAAMAFSATGTNAKLLAQLCHGTHASADRLMNLAFGNIIANTYDHFYAFSPACTGSVRISLLPRCE